MNKKELRRTVTLSQQFMEPESPSNLAPTRHATGHWDGSTIRSASGRTLFDIIQQDDNWKPVKDRLRLQRVGAAFSGGATIGDGAPPSPIVDGGESRMALSGGATSLKRNPTLARTISRSVSVRPVSSAATGLAQSMGEIVITEITDVTNEMPDEPEEEPAKGGGVSLMALLEQTDNRWGSEEGDDEASDIIKDDEHDEDEEEEAEGEKELYYTCCVCMVRHKGAAFVPCGHTFCRLCSRELWVSSGNCPLCNGFVQEILDIF